VELVNQSSTSTNAQPIPLNWVEKLFEEMMLSFGKKFADQWQGIDPAKLKAHWAQKMGELTNEEMVRGVKAMRNLDWPPSLPEFMRLCRPPLDHTKAYYEAIYGLQARAKGEMGEWSSPAVFWAATKMAFDLAGQPYSQIKTRWEAALDEQLAKTEWPAIPQPMIALPEPGKGTLSKEAATAMVKELKAETVVKSVASKVDHKLWAKRIMERHKRGDKTLSTIQINFAKEALRELAA
jgi:hypothetical protein